LYQKYGISAANSKLPDDTKIELTAKNKMVLVTINNHKTNESGEIIELSKEAAEVLEIKFGDIVPCSYQESFLENNIVLKYLKKMAPYIILILFIRYI